MSMRMAILAVLSFLCSGFAFAAEPEVVVAVSEAGEAFVVEATIRVPVAQRVAWEVLVDFDHMTGILNNLTASRVAARQGNVLVVRQEGVARFGLFSYAFKVEREIRLEPMKRILTRNLTGSLKRMESEVRLAEGKGPATQIAYRAEFVFDSVIAGLFGASFLHHEVEEQFRLMAAEMVRRDSELSAATLQQTLHSGP
ncbi:SRPBCC family protein [Dechloromonas sp. H13]|uniref:SRPBCC family protein n=1 Tax=Dechloromonas sp. H13 TaxID=2570193 RepID=UPI00129145E9|nr:SRPBCC family protein [Dechloromonas sp. H13]